MTLLSSIQQACGELGIDQPTQIFGSTDDQTLQLLAIAQREGKEFAGMALKNGGWQELHKDYTFLTVGGLTLTGNVTIGLTTITGLSSTAGITAGTWGVSGNGLGNTAYVVSLTSTTVTLNIPATATLTGVTFTFGQIAYSLPSDFSYFLRETFWDGSYRWQLLGPLDAQEKNVIKYGISPVGPRRRFWVEGNYLYINPNPTNNTDVIAYDYYSNGFALSASGAPQSTWMADTDTYALSEECFVLGVMWRWKRAKGLDYSEERAIYDKTAQRIMSRNGGSRYLTITNRSRRLHLLSDANIPDTGFGQ